MPIETELFPLPIQALPPYYPAEGENRIKEFFTTVTSYQRISRPVQIRERAKFLRVFGIPGHCEIIKPQQRLFLRGGAVDPLQVTADGLLVLAAHIARAVADHMHYAHLDVRVREYRPDYVMFFASVHHKLRLSLFRRKS